MHCNANKSQSSPRLKIKKLEILVAGMTLKFLSCFLLVLMVLNCNHQVSSKPAADDNAATASPVQTTQLPPSAITTQSTQQTTQTPGSVDNNQKIINATHPILPEPHGQEQYDSNKELIDYKDDFMNALHFVQTEKLAGSEGATKRVESMIAKHHNNEELYQYLLELSRQYPEITRLYSAGESVEGRKLWVLEITEEPGKHKLLKPEVKYVANMHGNEIVGREMLLHLARLLVENYRAALEEPVGDTKPTPPKFVKKLLRATRIHLMPSMNPDGYERANVSCTYDVPSKRGRLNANHVDLNRNFPDPLLNSSEDAATQPEVKALMKWSKEIPFVLSANFHGGALVVSLPYDGSLNTSAHKEIRLTPDDDVFMHLGRIYAVSHQTMWKGEVCYDECTKYHPEDTYPGGFIHGSEWYSMYGGMQDWIYQNTNSFETTIEMGCNQYPEAQALPQYWNYNKRALLNYIKQAHRGVKGTISDAITNVLLQNVTIYVVGRPHNISSTAYGDYFRLLMPGFYEIIFERENYKPERVSLTIDDTMPQIINIKLQPVGVPFRPTQTETGGSVLLPPSIPNSGGQVGESGDHSLVVATLTMTIIIVLILVAMAGAYVIQRRRLTRRQSVSLELQPTGGGGGGRSGAGTGISLPGQSSGSSTNQHLSA